MTCTKPQSQRFVHGRHGIDRFLASFADDPSAHSRLIVPNGAHCRFVFVRVPRPRGSRTAESDRTPGLVVGDRVGNPIALRPSPASPGKLVRHAAHRRSWGFVALVDRRPPGSNGGVDGSCRPVEAWRRRQLLFRRERWRARSVFASAWAVEAGWRWQLLFRRDGRGAESVHTATAAGVRIARTVGAAGWRPRSTGARSCGVSNAPTNEVAILIAGAERVSAPASS